MDGLMAVIVMVSVLLVGMLAAHVHSKHRDKLWEYRLEALKGEILDRARDEHYEINSNLVMLDKRLECMQFEFNDARAQSERTAHAVAEFMKQGMGLVRIHDDVDELKPEDLQPRRKRGRPPKQIPETSTLETGNG